MSIVLSHETALEFYRSPEVAEAFARRSKNRGNGRVGSLRIGRPVPLSRCSNLRKADALRARGLLPGGLSKPLHALVFSAEDRRGLNGVNCHCSTVDLKVLSCTIEGASKPSLHVVSPELLYAQMAHSLNMLELIQLGFELCGSYSLNPSGDGFWQREPYTSVKDIARFLTSQQRCVSRKASNALRFVLDGAASPREVQLALLMTLPRHKGGYGLPQPNLNSKIAVPRVAKHIIPKSHYVCDLLWPEQHVAMEYDSDAFHTGTQKIAEDSSRRNALNMLGVSLVTVTNEQVKRIDEMDRLARTLSRRLGKRTRNSVNYDFRARQLQLRAELLT